MQKEIRYVLHTDIRESLNVYELRQYSYLKQHKPMLHLPITYNVNMGKCYRLLVAINDPLRFLPGR